MKITFDITDMGVDVSMTEITKYFDALLGLPFDAELIITRQQADTIFSTMKEHWRYFRGIPIVIKEVKA